MFLRRLPNPHSRRNVSKIGWVRARQLDQEEGYVAGCIGSAGYPIEDGNPSAWRQGAHVLAHESKTSCPPHGDRRSQGYVENWRDALDAVQKRHPILSTSINRNEEGQPALHQADGALPLRVVDGSVQGCWELEVDREMAVPFNPDQGPLLRSVLIHKPQSAVLILVAHHAIADGMSLVFLIRDLLQVLSGGQMEALSFSSTAEELLSKLPKGEAPVQAEASQAGTPRTEPARYRQDDGLVPRVISRKLDEHLTATLKERARHEGNTVQGAICAALVLAGRKTSSTWRKQSVRVMSPVNARAHLRAGEACGLYLGGGGMITFQPADSRAFWELARFAKKEIAPSQTLQSLSTSLHGLKAIMTKDMGVETAAPDCSWGVRQGSHGFESRADAV
jgi:Condensation domain